MKLTSFSANVDNKFSAPALIAEGDKFCVAASGSFVGTLTVQVRPKGAAYAHDWADVHEFTTFPAARLSRTLPGEWEARVGVKTGDRTSGTVFADILVSRART